MKYQLQKDSIHFFIDVGPKLAPEIPQTGKNFF